MPDSPNAAGLRPNKIGGQEIFVQKQGLGWSGPKAKLLSRWY